MLLSILTTLISILYPPLVDADVPQTAVFQPPFSSFRPCVQQCFVIYWPVACHSDIIGDTLGCCYSACSTISGTDEPQFAEDSCYCRADLQGVAEGHISSCISKACTQGGDTMIDIKSAVDYYDGYCAGTRYSKAEPSTAEASTTENTKAAVSTTDNTNGVASTTEKDTSGGISTSTIAVTSNAQITVTATNPPATVKNTKVLLGTSTGTSFTLRGNSNGLLGLDTAIIMCMMLTLMSVGFTTL